jgi:AcrR family transcriptional regulator
MRGRPRDPELDARIRDHALDLLLDRGIEGTTMDEIAARAGAGKASVYRRWSSKEDLVLDALDHVVRAEIPIPDTGSLRTDLELAWGDLLRFVASPRGRVLIRLLLAAPGLAEGMERVHRNLWARQQEMAAASLERARERGELRAEVADDAVIDQLMGPILARVVTGRALPEPADVPGLVELTLHGIGAP